MHAEMEICGASLALGCVHTASPAPLPASFLLAYGMYCSALPQQQAVPRLLHVKECSKLHRRRNGCGVAEPVLLATADDSGHDCTPRSACAPHAPSHAPRGPKGDS